MIKKEILYNFLTILLKSFLTTLVIGYIIFNIIYVRNQCPMNENIFWCQSNEQVPDWDGRYIISDQPIIFYEYSEWVFNALFLDFGVFDMYDKAEVFDYALNALSLSFFLILVTLIVGLLISILLIFLQKFPFIRDNIIEPILSLSFIHIAIYAIYFKYFLTDPSLLSSFLLCFITALGSGILFDFYTLLNNEHKFIMDKDYVTFARNSGFNEYRFAYKELVMSIIYISTSRIPIIFGSMIIIEILSQGYYKGIGFSIWANVFVQNINYSAFFGSVFLSIAVFTFLYYLTEHIKLSVLEK